MGSTDHNHHLQDFYVGYWWINFVLGGGGGGQSNSYNENLIFRMFFCARVVTSSQPKAVLILCVFRGFRGVHRCGVTLLSVPPKTTVLVSAAHCNYICKDSAGYPVETCCCRNIKEPSTCRGVRHNLLYKRRFCPALTKLALDLQVNLCILYSFLFFRLCVFRSFFQCV